MRIEEIYDYSLSEGPNDPSIFKAVWTAGGPGSGKTFAVKNTGPWARTVNSDTQFEFPKQE